MAAPTFSNNRARRSESAVPLDFARAATRRPENGCRRQARRGERLPPGYGAAR
jgi:hypothetical protein